LQCVVLRAGPSDLQKMLSIGGISTAAVVSFMERAGTPQDEKFYRTASPITHVSRSSPAGLLLHGDADDIVPLQQSVALEEALRKANVSVKLVRVAGGAHGSDFGTEGKPHPQFQDILGETVSWLDQHLKAAR